LYCGDKKAGVDNFSPKSIPCHCDRLKDVDEVAASIVAEKMIAVGINYHLVTSGSLAVENHMVSITF
jgi:hypothetical protein